MADDVNMLLRLMRQRPDQRVNEDVLRAIMGPIEQVPSEVMNDPRTAILFGLLGPKAPKATPLPKKPIPTRGLTDAERAELNPYPAKRAAFENSYKQRLAEIEAREAAAIRAASAEASPSPRAASQAEAASGIGPSSLPPQPPSRGRGDQVPGTFVDYDPATHGQASRQLLDDMLTQAERTRSPNLSPEFAQRLAEAAQARHALQGLPQADPASVLQRARGTTDELRALDEVLRSTGRGSVTAPAARGPVLNASTGRDHTLAIPAAATGAGALGAMSGGGDAQAASVNDLMALAQLLEQNKTSQGGSSFRDALARAMMAE